MFNNIKRKLLISFLTLFVLSLVYLFPTNKQYEETLKFKEAKYHSIYLLNKNILVETKIVSNNKTDILEQIKDIIERTEHSIKASVYYDWFMVGVIIVSILPLMFMQTYTVFKT